MRKLLLLITIVVSLALLSRGSTIADGTYTALGTADSIDGSADAINFSQGRVWTIDQYGKYIWLTQERTGNSHWAWSNDSGANWSQGSEGYGFLTRGSVAYDSINDKLHVIWAATDSNDGIIYRRYGITRDGSNNVTAIAREDSSNINLQLDTSSSRTLEQPVALWINDGSADGLLVAIWSKSGSSLNEVRASMRRLSISAADGTAGNWIALDGSADTFSTDPPAVAGDKIYGDTSGTNGSAAIIRGGSGSYKDDLYVFVHEDDGNSGDQLLAYRASWDDNDNDWSGGWQSPVTVATTDLSSGYNLKRQLITKPVLDTTHDRLYIGFARWKDGTNGDTASIAYLNSSNAASSTVDLYSALGTHSYAPTLDIAYDEDQDYVYGAYVESTTNGSNGSIKYKTYDGSTVSSATTFYTSPGGSGGEDGSADIPILYENRSSNDRLLFAFRINGALPPTALDPHEIDWGYISLPTQPTVQFTSTTGSGSESTTSVNLGLSLSGSFTRDITVNYAVTGGTATGSGTDYTLSSGTATIAAGDTTTNIPVTIVNDSEVESNETIIVTISSPTFATLGSNTTHTYTITDNDTNSSSSSSSNSSSSVSAPSCTATTPEKSPWLYSASPEDTNSVKLFFSDDSTNVDSYVLEYGTQSNKYNYSSTNIGGKGTRTYTVKSLASNTNYYFRLRNNNDCATGNWSSEITTKTKSSQKNSLEFVTTIEKSDISTPKPSATPITTKTEEPSTTPTPAPAIGGYDVQVKVVDEDKKPVENAKVTMHSTPRTTYTDKNGIATFNNVEKGQHKLQIAYDNFEGEQGLTVEGDTKNINLNVEIKKKSSTVNNAMYLIVGLILGGIIMVILTRKILLHKK